MIKSKGHKVLKVLILCSMLALSSGKPFIPHTLEEHVSTSLHGSVTLPSNFSFIQSLEGLTVIWEKKENDNKHIVYWILKGQENLEEQDPRYRGRVDISTEFSQGNLDLILRDVTHEDAGTYYCRAANQNAHGDKKVTLSIDDIKTEVPYLTITVVIFIFLFIIFTFVIIIYKLYKKNKYVRKSKKSIFSRSCGELLWNFTEYFKKPEITRNKPPPYDTSITNDLISKEDSGIGKDDIVITMEILPKLNSLLISPSACDP